MKNIEILLPSIFIIRGVPGSGKTTLANKIISKLLECNRDLLVKICETDRFHINNDGIYDFKPKLLGAFHLKNVDDVRLHMAMKYNVIIISNTSIEKDHYSPYINLAKEFKYNINIIWKESPSLEDANKRCIHGVPASKIEEMYRKRHKDINEIVLEDNDDINLIIKNIS